MASPRMAWPPIRALIRILENLGCANVRTYIQSGNDLFQADGSDAASLSRRIAASVGRSHAFHPGVLVLKLRELENAAAA